MRTKKRDEFGDTLIEVLIAIIVIGVVASGLFTSIATSASASRAHRNLTTADAVLRNYAEAAKQAVRTQCNAGNAGAALTVDYTPPTGVGVSAPPAQLVCPQVNSGTPANNVQEIDISATVLNLKAEGLKIFVRTP